MNGVEAEIFHKYLQTWGNKTLSKVVRFFKLKDSWHLKRDFLKTFILAHKTYTVIFEKKGRNICSGPLFLDERGLALSCP